MAAAPSLPDLVSAGGRILAGLFNGGVRACLSWVMKDAPMALVAATAQQTVPYATWTSIQLPQVRLDTGGLTGATPDTPSRIYIGRCLGWYAVQGVVATENPTAGRLAARIALNGAQVDTSIGHGGGTVPCIAMTPVTFVQATDPGDYIEVQALVIDATSDQTAIASWHSRSSLSATYLRTN